MKKYFIIMATALLTAGVFAQVPQKMSYQAVIRNNSNALVTDQVIGMRISILQESETGTAVYIETQTPKTNTNGLASVQIGGGTVVTGSFANIDWSSGPYFVKTETDPTGNTNYTITSISQLLSVPYALYAENLRLVNKNKYFDLYISDAGNIQAFPKIHVEKPYKTVPTVTDASGYVYETVKIGNQVWMSENLKTTKYKEGTNIPNVTDNTIWAGLTTGAYCNYNNTLDTVNINTYGRLYNWYSVNDSKGLCPTGWHVPTNAEWDTLSNYLGGNDLSGGRLKETGTKHWKIPNTDATNHAGFTALPGGYRYIDGYFGYIGNNGVWWSSTENYTLNSVSRYLNYSNEYLSNIIYNKYYGFSVRCLRD